MIITVLREKVLIRSLLFVRARIRTSRAPDKRVYRGEIKDNFSSFSMKTYVVTSHYNRLDETVLMMSHKICFNGKISQLTIITILSLLPLLIWSTGPLYRFFTLEAQVEPCPCKQKRLYKQLE